MHMVHRSKTSGQTGRSLTQKVPDVLKVLKKLKNLESKRCKEDNTTDGKPRQDVLLFCLLSSKAFKLFEKISDFFWLFLRFEFGILEFLFS